jgi:hypothetical protein
MKLDNEVRDMEQEYLTTEELAARWKMQQQTLELWRCNGKGPAFHKFGKAVRYAVSDVEKYETESKIA